MPTKPSFTSFNDSVEELLGRIECRRVTQPNDEEAIYRLRYASYLREDAIAPNSALSISDPFDAMPNGYLFGFYIDGQLASTIRLNVTTKTSRDIPAMAVFSDVLQPLLDAGKVLLDPTRFVISDEHVRAHPKLAYVTLRVAWLATEFFDVDYTLASVRTEHQAFYKRFYGHKVICPARPYPSLVKPLSLMLLDFRPAQARGLRRYPFLHSTRAERDALFGAAPSQSFQALRSSAGTAALRPSFAQGY